MFVSAYGAEAGNLALKVLSVGGLYVGGGIAPRILEKLKDGTFMKAFTDKGRLSQLLINMPVRVILESRTALMGAAAYAEARAAELSGVSPRAGSVKALKLTEWTRASCGTGVPLLRPTSLMVFFFAALLSQGRKRPRNLARARLNEAVCWRCRKSLGRMTFSATIANTRYTFGRPSRAAGQGHARAQRRCAGGRGGAERPKSAWRRSLRWRICRWRIFLKSRWCRTKQTRSRG